MELEGCFDVESQRRILEPYAYICDNPGKNIRGTLVDAFQYWLHIPSETTEIIKTIVNELHDASLL